MAKGNLTLLKNGMSKSNYFEKKLNGLNNLMCTCCEDPFLVDNEN
jgi:hypothetical protein